ncbi:MAG: DUF6036 family nucleotidyltransferase [Nakamurella sp.]
MVGVEVSTATLAPDWAERAILRRYPGVARPVRFLDRHDLVISKLVAGREKDLRFAPGVDRWGTG